MKNKEIKIYALSTCIWCKKTLDYFKEKECEFDHVFVDLLEDPESSKAKAEMKQHSTQKGFPMVVIDGVVVMGFDTDGFERELSK